MATEIIAEPRIGIRKAKDHIVAIGGGSGDGDAHRAVFGHLIDYRLQEATDGAARGVATVAGNFIDKPAFVSDWHVHNCGMQIAIVLSGSLALGLADDLHVRAHAGEIMFIPGGVVHTALAPSADYQVLELTFPGEFGTTETDVPPAGSGSQARVWGPSAATRTEVAGGLEFFVYPVEASYADRYDLRRIWRSRVLPFAPTVRVHDDKVRLLVVTQGWIESGEAAEPDRLEKGDILVVPPGTERHDVAVSDDFEAIEVRILQ
ncbi:cupin domain-containing protein [Sphingomonas mali]|uniref:cupin domain-containing protein n=1 Tax=Sphingomonas mali TaxID=40682 RepID=UPI0008337980|nr:cupin domain-containing protein [Sphingomonas mali]